MEQVPSPPICILETRDDDDDSLYSCYEAMQLMAVQPIPSTCLLDQPYFASVMFLSCGEQVIETDDIISNDEGRKLRGKKSKSSSSSREDVDYEDDMSNDADLEDRVEDQDYPTGYIEEKVAIGSNDQGLESFVAEDCNVGCRMVGDHICFRSTELNSYEEKVYVLTFAAEHGGGLDMFTVEVSVEKDTSGSNLSSSNCDIAQTFCEEPMWV